MTFGKKEKKNTFNYYIEVSTAAAIAAISRETGFSKSEIVSRILRENSAIKAELQKMEKINDS